MYHGGGDTGILVPVGAVLALAQALGRVLFDPAEREGLGQTAPGRAAVYDVANWTRQWGELLVIARGEEPGGRKATRVRATILPRRMQIARHIIGMARLGTTRCCRETAPLCVESNLACVRQYGRVRRHA